MIAAVARGYRSARQLPLMVICVGAILALIVIIAILAPYVAPADPSRQTLIARLRPPGFVAAGRTYWFGTDDLGRDLLSRVIWGARASLLVALFSVAVSLTVGTLLGMLAAWFRGWVEIVIMRLVDIMLSIPAILLAVLTVAVLGPGFIKLILVLGLTRWPRYTRVAYAQTLQVSSLPYIKAAELGGLSFLGLGIQPPQPSWGSIMSAGRQYVERAWWITLFPGAFLFLLVLSVNVFGDWLRDRLDPRSRTR